jgi:hypothetical protein
METKLKDQLFGLYDSILAFLPNLLAGIILILLGWLIGWLIKRVLVQFAVVIRVDRFLRKSRWEADFSKADVRHGVYNFIGNVGYIIVFMLFLDNALIAWKLTMWSNLLMKGILFLPKIIIAVVIFGLGWLLAMWAQTSILKSLYKEQVPRASLIARFIKVIIMLFFSAIALVELDVARQIVTIGFATIIITIGAISVVIAAIGGKNFIARIGDTFREDQAKEQE